MNNIILYNTSVFIATISIISGSLMIILGREDDKVRNMFLLSIACGILAVATKGF